MYYRVYNIKSFDETVSFIDILKRFYNSIIYNDDYDPNDSKSRSYYTSVDFDEKDYCFANGKVSDNKFTPLFLYKNESGYKVLLVYFACRMMEFVEEDCAEAEHAEYNFDPGIDLEGRLSLCVFKTDKW